MPSWRETCAATPASLSEVSAACCPSPCRLPSGSCLPERLRSNTQAACQLPKGAQPPVGLCSGAGTPSGDPPGALCMARAQAHVCVLAHPHHTPVRACTPAPHMCRLEPVHCTPMHTHTFVGYVSVNCQGWRDDRRGAAASQQCSSESPLF